MKDTINDSLLHRFLNRETTEDENSEILHWVSVSEENRAEFRSVHDVFHLSKVKQFQVEIDVDIAWEKLNKKLPKVAGRQMLIQLNFLRKIAVVVLATLAIGFCSLWTSEHFLNQSNSAIVQFEAPKGEKSKIVLADGSHVLLNSQSILKYDALKPRKVSIQGEAYFEVQKDKAHPFEVTTVSGMKVIVTGTKFNLRCYGNEPYVETTLEEGEVSISSINSDELAVLKPGQQAKFNLMSKDLQVQNVSIEIYTIWKNNELRFSDISFEELVPRIERWYGVSIKLDPKIGRKDRFKLTIKTESLRELLHMMQLTSKFDYEINGSSVKITSK
jgi:ferric-dicitrate binding protein FerR (iron transport regulator)